jgi:hypothetical protein
MSQLLTSLEADYLRVAANAGLIKPADIDSSTSLIGAVTVAIISLWCPAAHPHCMIVAATNEANSQIRKYLLVLEWVICLPFNKVELPRV